MSADGLIGLRSRARHPSPVPRARRRYERAARELLQREKIKLEQAHATQLQALRSEAENDTERQSMGAELRLQRADELAREERKELEEEATERIEKLEVSRVACTLANGEEYARQAWRLGADSGASRLVFVAGHD